MAPRKPIVIIVLLLTTLFFYSGDGWSMTDQQLEDRIKQLEKKLKKEKRKASKRAKSIGKKFEKSQDRLQFNGFVSGGVATSDVAAEHIIGIKDNPVYAVDTIIGLQANFSINKKSEAVLQLVARGNQANDVEAEWGYLSYSFKPTITMRAGRLRAPFYINSEVLEVGYAYPWVRPPIDIYNQAPPTSYYGVDLTLDYSFMGWDNSVQFINGSDTLTIGDIAEADLDKMYGMILTFTHGPFTLRAGGMKAGINIIGEFNLVAPQSVLDSPAYQSLVNPVPSLIGDYEYFLATELFNANSGMFSSAFDAGLFLSTAFDLSSLEFLNLGVSYDDGTWVVLTEGTKLNMTGEFLNISAFYTTIGRHFNKFLPFVMYSNSYTTDTGLIASSIGEFIPPLVNGLGFAVVKQQTYSIGLRWNPRSDLALKIQYDHMTQMEGTNGKFLTSPGANADLYSFVIDAVF
ncbi:MAG: hypothetical protein JKY67_06115 [Pseudomonadales bacterium]|nr:hypothetical protein [Pseudomonadales bacterium]